MWVRKSETEIQQILAQREADKKNLIRPVLFAAAITIVVMLLYSLGFRGSTQRFIVQPAEDLNWRLIVAGLLVFTTVAGVAIHRQRKRGQFLGAMMRFCAVEIARNSTTSIKTNAVLLVAASKSQLNSFTGVKRAIPRRLTHEDLAVHCYHVADCRRCMLHTNSAILSADTHS
jgi:hypothetical protein